MGKKSLTKKKRLVKATRQIKRIPAFVIARTKRKVLYNRRRRDWRREKLGITE
ncbi:50S ribosomal protein L39e [Candidatus Micrarchaeota archaeon]|nr:50S ribosomal protein L39e [Candidatus Micrarchaeota archaeon]